MAHETAEDGLPPTPDFDSYPVPATILAVAREAGGSVLRLDWSGGRTSRYHAIWLRDNAGDPENLNLETREQWRDVTALAEGTRIAAAETDAMGALLIRWTPGGCYMAARLTTRRPASGGSRVAMANARSWCRDSESWRAGKGRRN